MGVSRNGSEGLGGDAEGFEIVNQGVTRRSPGEGPKANGGRSQLQTMDSYDQPQYEAIDVPTGDDEPSDDPWGMNQTCDRCGAEGNWDNAICSHCQREDREEAGRTVGPEQNEQTCPACDGKGGQCDGCGGAGTFEAYLNAEVDRGMNEEMPPMNSPDAQGWDRQIAQGITNPGRDVSDERPPQLEAMFGGEEKPDDVGPERIMWSPGEYGSDVKKVLQYLDKDEWAGNSMWLKLNQAGPHAMIDVDTEEAIALSNALSQFLQTARYDTKNVNLAEDVIEQIESKFGEIPAPKGFYEGKEEELKKSSEKEKKEHPWATKAQAKKIAQDHMKLGEVFKIRKVKP